MKNRRGGLSSLSLATRISVKDGPGAWGCFYLSPIISPELTCAQGPSLWVLFVTCGVLPVLPHSTGYVRPQDFLCGPLCPLTAAALLKCVVPRTLFNMVESTAMPFPTQLLFGVQGQTYKRQWQVFFFVNFGEKWGSTFYSCLTFQCSQRKIK